MMSRNFGVVLVRPEIPQNVGAIIRTCACFGIDKIHVVGPVPFLWDPYKARRVMMDYHQYVEYVQHEDFDAFLPHATGPLIGTSPSAEYSFHNKQYQDGSMFVFGSESVGLDLATVEKLDEMVKIPMVPGPRSLNLGVAAGVILGHVFAVHSEKCQSIVLH